MGTCSKPIRKGSRRGERFPSCGKATENDELLCHEHLEAAKVLLQSDLDNYAVKGPGDCIEWTKDSKTDAGYGILAHRGILGSMRDDVAPSTTAHRAALYLSGRVGRPLHDFGHVDHTCRTRACINSDHLVEMGEVLHMLLEDIGRTHFIDSAILKHFLHIYPEAKEHIEEVQKLVNIRHLRSVGAES